MGHGLGGVLSATPAFSCLRPAHALTSLKSIGWITVYRTPRTALRNLYTASRAGLTGRRDWDIGSESWLRGGGLPAAGSFARSPSGPTASADPSFAKVSTSHKRWRPCSGDRSVAALRRSRREPVTRLGLLPFAAAGGASGLSRSVDSSGCGVAGRLPRVLGEVGRQMVRCRS